MRRGIGLNLSIFVIISVTGAISIIVVTLSSIIERTVVNVQSDMSKSQ